MTSPDILPGKRNFIKKHARELTLGVILGASSATAAVAGGASVGSFLNVPDMQPGIDLMYTDAANALYPDSKSKDKRLDKLMKRQSNEGFYGIVLLGVSAIAAASAVSAGKRIIK